MNACCGFHKSGQCETGGGGMEIGGDVTSGTAGSVPFIGSGSVLSQDNAAFFWDETNDALGIGTNTPNTFGKLAVYPDTDILAVVGKVKFGATGGAADHVYISHIDFGDTALRYGIRFDPDGDVTLQSVGGTANVSATTASGVVTLMANAATRFRANNTGIGFFTATPVAQQAIAGSRGGNAALADLLTKLALTGLITDGTTA